MAMISMVGSMQSATCGSCGEVVLASEAGTEATTAKKHLVCPNEAVACPFTSAGCSEKVARQGTLELKKSKC